MIGHAFTVFSFLLVGVGFGGSPVNGPYDRRPFLMIDGKALARALFDEICIDPRTFSSRHQHRNVFVSGVRGYLSRKIDENLLNESQLVSWIKAQPLNSVDPLSLARQAIEIEGGNSLQGLRLGYNVLSEARRVRSRLARDRRPPPDFFDHLVDVTGERELMREYFANNPSVPGGVSTRGSKNSTWYHLFGAAMIAFDQGELVTVPMIAAENLFDFRPDSRKRYLSNYESAAFGTHLAQLIKSGPTGCRDQKIERKAFLRDRPELLSVDYGRRYEQGRR